MAPRRQTVIHRTDYPTHLPKSPHTTLLPTALVERHARAVGVMSIAVYSARARFVDHQTGTYTLDIAQITGVFTLTPAQVTTTLKRLAARDLITIEDRRVDTEPGLPAQQD